MNEEKHYYAVSGRIYLLNDAEVALLADLYKNGLLRFDPKPITVYETKNKAK